MCPPTNLSSYRKLEQDELIKLQNEDERVALIKEAMGVTGNAFKKLYETENTCDEHLLFKKFTMRSGIVFRKFFSKRNDKDLFTVYVPTSILRDVIMHTHLSESHSSGRQT